VALKHVAEGMGLDWNGQYQRVKRDAVLSTCMCVTHMQVGGQGRDVVTLPLRFLNGFLFGIDASRRSSHAARAMIGPTPHAPHASSTCMGTDPCRVESCG